MDNGHDSDCATHNAPAYPAGPCDCLPTQAMCRAAVMYANGAAVYERGIPGKVLEIEEGIYAEVWKAMQAAAPAVLETEARTLRLRYGVVSGWIMEALKVLDTLDPESTEEADELRKLIAAGEVLALTTLANSKTPNVGANRAAEGGPVERPVVPL